jgi:hypothetical protein
MWTPPLAPLQCAHGMNGQAGDRRKFFLRKTRRFPQRP